MIAFALLILLIVFAPVLILVGSFAALGAMFVLFIAWLFALVGAVVSHTTVTRAGEE